MTWNYEQSVLKLFWNSNKTLQECVVEVMVRHAVQKLIILTLLMESNRK